MTEFLAEYGLFLLKVATVVALRSSLSLRQLLPRVAKPAHEGLEVENLNKKYRKIASRCCGAPC